MRAALALVLLAACLRAALVIAWALRPEPRTPPVERGTRSLVRSFPRPLRWASASAAAPGREPRTSPEPPSLAWSSPTESPGCRGDQDCPPWSSCEEQAGRAACHCALGYHLSPDLGCVPVKAFPGQVLLQTWGTSNQSLPDSAAALEAAERLPSLAAQIQAVFQHILGRFGGYLGSSARDREWPQGDVVVLHHFSARALVTVQQVEEAVALFRETCRHGTRVRVPACTFLHLVDVDTYQSLSLCQFDICDSISTTCFFEDGLVRCACRPGYRQAYATDRTCTACESGFWLLNDTCVRCPFGFSGAACQEPFLLALVVVSCVSGLLVLVTIVVPFSRRAQLPKERPSQHLLPSSTLSLPRVRPPWALQEPEGSHVERWSCPSRWEPEVEQQPAGASPMKTFLRSPPASPLSHGGCTNSVFVSDVEEEAKRSHF